LPFPGDITTQFECANCQELELHFRFARSAVAAEGMMLDLIHRWKYQRALWLEPFFAKVFVAEAQAGLANEPWDLIVPVPLHSLKEREREFNQSEHLAGYLGYAMKLPVADGAVDRMVATSTQTQLTRSERDDNMRCAFVPGPTIETVRGRRVVLVDDVFTTGATTSGCARVLREAGMKDVCVWTLARGLLH